MRNDLNVEGYWYSKYSPEYLMPQAQAEPWPGKAEFLKALDRWESDAHVVAYRGWSTCRICGCHNGSEEFEHDGWRWPQGYKHYIVEHNVKPSLAFYHAVMRKPYACADVPREHNTEPSPCGEVTLSAPSACALRED